MRPRHRTARAPRRLALPVILAALASAAVAAHPSEVGGQAADTLRQPGLEAPVEILVDRWGVPHIYAKTEHDLFFAQGWNAARDRLFQLELWRRQATGTVAEILGPRELERDVGTRLLNVRPKTFEGDFEEELDHYHPRGARIVRAFVEGVNAYVAHVEERPELLPPEFEMLGIRPGRWSPAVVVSRHQGLLGNMPSELHYGRAVARVGPEKVQELMGFGPGRPELALDPAIDPEHLFDDVLRLYEAFHSPVRFRPEDVAPAFRAEPREQAAGSGAAEAAVWPGDPTAREAPGSNNWAVRPEGTLSGRALLANDPHRRHQAPSLRYLVHLVGPGWNVIGAGEPTIPGVSIGHNGVGAWGLTVFDVDGEDLYYYTTHPEDPDLYRYGDDWERMRVVVDTIPVQGRAPEVVELRYTRHGPVLHRDTARRVAWALRAAWREPGGAPYLASLRMDQATSWEAFREACEYSHIPGENMVWADTTGTIGWQAVGIAPVRPNWSGLVPVPGDGRYEWAGYLPIRRLPHAVDPPEGFIATANEARVPAGYPHRDAVGWDFSDPFRSARLHEVLASGRRHTLGDMARLQMDLVSVPARNLTPLLAGLSSDDPSVEAARERLLDWDHVLAPASATAGLYEAWQRRLRAALADAAIPEAARPHLRWLSMERTVRWLTSPPTWLGPDPVAARDGLLMDALAAAVTELTERFGQDPAGWRYGREAYKHALIRHPLSRAVRPEVRDRLDVGPAPRGGDAWTVNNTGSGNNQTSGASFRLVVEVGAWDGALAGNAPGQSGVPGHPHYDDLFEPWAADRHVPLYYSREPVEAVTGRRWILSPP